MTREDLLDTLYIEFAPVIVPAFQKAPGYWTHYEKIREADVTSVTVWPTLRGEKISSDTAVTELNCSFDPDVYSTKTFGLVYGDEQFEENIDLYVRGTLGLMHLQAITYSEAGMQSEDYINMDVLSSWHPHLADWSRHKLLPIVARKNVIKVEFSDFHWKSPNYEELKNQPRPFDPLGYEE